MGDHHGPGEGAHAAGMNRAGQEVRPGIRAVRRRRQHHGQSLQESLVAAFLRLRRIQVDDVPGQFAGRGLGAELVEIAGVDPGVDLDAAAAREGPQDGLLLALRIDTAPGHDGQRPGQERGGRHALRGLGRGRAGAVLSLCAFLGRRCRGSRAVGRRGLGPRGGVRGFRGPGSVAWGFGGHRLGRCIARGFGGRTLGPRYGGAGGQHGGPEQQGERGAAGTSACRCDNLPAAGGKANETLGVETLGVTAAHSLPRSDKRPAGGPSGCSGNSIARVRRQGNAGARRGL